VRLGSAKDMPVGAVPVKRKCMYFRDLGGTSDTLPGRVAGWQSGGRQAGSQYSMK